MASKQVWKARARIRLIGWRQTSLALASARQERNQWRQYCANARENAAGHAAENTDLRHERQQLEARMQAAEVDHVAHAEALGALNRVTVERNTALALADRLERENADLSVLISAAVADLIAMDGDMVIALPGWPRAAALVDHVFPVVMVATLDQKPAGTICSVCGHNYAPFRYCPQDHRGLTGSAT